MNILEFLDLFGIFWPFCPNILLRFGKWNFFYDFDLNNNMICHDSPSWFLSRFCLLGGYLIGSSLILFSSYWVVFCLFLIRLGRFALFSLYWVILPFFSLYWVILPFFHYIGSFCPFSHCIGSFCPFFIILGHSLI